jgi:hypothetical protein
LVALCAAACGGGEIDGAVTSSSTGAGGSAGAATTPTGTHVSMDFTLAGGFWSAPFPSDARVHADGTVDTTGFPDPTNNALVHRVLALVEGKRGFGVTSGVFFSLDGPLADGQLPDVHQSVAAPSPVFLVSVDPAAADHGTRYPLRAGFSVDGGPFGAPNLLALLPQQGIPLRPGTLYAAVVTRDLRDASGAPLVPSTAMSRLAQKQRPEGMSDLALAAHEKAIVGLKALGVDVSRIAAMTAFTTDDPTKPLQAVLADALARPTPAPIAPFVPLEVFDEYCVFQSTVKMPVYQNGTPPYADVGGRWTFDAAGKPILDHEEDAHVFVTVPRAPMPAAGWPAVVFSRTGGGGDRPLVDRGPQPATGKPALVAGTGPALHFARAGFAGVQIDGPLGGPLRNPSGQDEQFLVFNVANPAGLQDNVRQSAVELALAAHITAKLSIDVSTCPGASPKASFDAGNLALMGHSMGATIAPLAIAFEPLYRALLLSGAGGSWIENVIDKKEPTEVKGKIEVLLAIIKSGYHLHELDPLLTMFQWAAEGADPPVYGRHIVTEPTGGKPRSVLMMQGIVDHYILPSIANASTLSFGLDLAGGSIDAMTPELASFVPAASLVDLAGRSSIPLPAQGNVGMSTAVVVQHPGDGIEDGHEVVFQTDPPKKQYRCFLASLLKGVPKVPVRGPATDPCE